MTPLLCNQSNYNRKKKHFTTNFTKYIMGLQKYRFTKITPSYEFCTKKISHLKQNH